MKFKKDKLDSDIFHIILHVRMLAKFQVLYYPVGNFLW